MKRWRFQHSWGIRRRVLFLAIVPMVLVSIAIGFYLTQAHLGYMRAAMEQRGDAIARYLAFAGEFSLLIDDRTRLQHLVEQAFLGPEVEAVIILDDQGRVVARKSRSGFFVRAHHGAGSGGLLEFQRDVYPTTAAEDAESEELRGVEPDHRLGRVLVYISRDHLRATARDVIVRSVLFILFGLLFASLLALLLARELLAPIQRITDLVGRVQRGDLSSRLARRSGAEFGELEQGINRMVKTIEGSQKDLELRVAQATARLRQTVEALRQQQVALEASRREAIEAGKAKERFLALVSHELRTQLNAIVGFAELLEKSPGRTESMEYVQIINNASRQLLAIIDDVLSYSGLNAGTLKVERKPFSPEAVLEDVVSLLSRDAHRKGLELVLLIHRDTPHCVMGDPVRFSQVVSNLLINAIKFTDSGEILVVSEALVDDGKRFLQVSVDDSGIGIDAEMRDQLFEPFVQGDSSIQKRFGGTGLGLAISRSLMERMGGRIWLDDSMLGGSRFCIALPLAAVDDVPDEDDQRRALAGVRVLVADSHAVSRRAIKNTLLYFGMEVYLQPQRVALETVLQEAVEGARAFEVLVIGGKAQEFPPQRMERLQQAARDFDLRILVLISDEGQVRHKQRLVKKKSCIVVSTKPIRRQRLLENLRQVIDCSGPRKIRAPGRRQRARRMEATVLVADDNDFSRQLLQASLERAGVEVVGAADGFELLERARERKYDIIFLDINMPALDGISAARLIREESINDVTPLVAVTADLFTREARDSRAALFDETLYKPVSPDDVIVTVERLLQRRVDTAASADAAATLEGLWQPARFRAALEEQLAMLEPAIAAMDRDRVRAIAHQINGLTGYFGHGSLSAAGRRLEEMAGSADRAALRQCYSRIRAEMEKL